MQSGGCLCASVRFTIEGPLAAIQICHCSQCRKAQGGPFATNIPVDVAVFRIMQGSELLSEFESSPGKLRVFCRRCGSPILSRRPSIPGTVRIRAGSLDEPAAIKPGFHIYAGSSAAWWPVLDDGLPRHEAMTPVPPTA